MVSQAEIHEMASSLDADQRREAARLLGEEFGILENKRTAWEDLIRLAGDAEINVEEKAADALGVAFQHIVDKKMAWDDLHRLSRDENKNLRYCSAAAIGKAFVHLPEKNLAWNVLKILLQDKDELVRFTAAEALIDAFSYVPDRELACNSLHKFSNNIDWIIRWLAAILFRDDYTLISDKEMAWNDLHMLSQDENEDVRSLSADAIGEVFIHLSNKRLAWNDLHILSQDKNECVRSSSAKSIGKVFIHLPDKELAWNDLHRLSQDENESVRINSSDAISEAFAHLPDKELAWNDLKRQTQLRSNKFQFIATANLGSAFPHMESRELAWNDLHMLSQDENDNLRCGIAWAFYKLFPIVPDKEDAWNDLIRLTQDRDGSVRWLASESLNIAFALIPKKDFALNDLHRLTLDQDKEVRKGAAEALGNLAPVTDKTLACRDLHRMTEDLDSGVRCISYYSLGRISILMATENDNDLRTHLYEAIEFFRRSSEEDKFSNPAAFCLPFYRSLHSLLFNEVPREDEVQKYLAEAKGAIRTSESKEILLEAVNNLSKALQEIRAYSVEDIVLRRRDLKSYTKYCLQAAECLREARSKAPLASKIVDYTLLEKSIPILDQKIKALFKDVEATAGELCKSTKGTDLEPLGRDVYESTRGLDKVESWIAADRYLEEIVPLLKSHCNRLPREAQAYLKTLVDSQDTASLEKRFDTLKSVLLASLVQGENDDRLVKELKELLDLHLQNIEFAILKLNTSSGNDKKDLYSLKNQIDGLQREIESQGLAKKELAEALDEKDRAMIDRLEKMRAKMLQAVRETTQLNASKRDVGAILKELEDQDKLKKRDVLGIIADLSSLAGMALSILL